MPFATLPSVVLHYLQIARNQNSKMDCGNLVMIHGLAANLAFWRLRSAPALAGICDVTAYDLRGHGISEMPKEGYTPEQMALDLKWLLDFLRIDRAHLLAHSFGGVIAVHFALRYPERVQSLILADVRLKSIQEQNRMRDWEHWPKLQKRLETHGITLNDESVEGGYEFVLKMMRWQSRHKTQIKNRTGLPSQISRITGGRKTAKRWLRLHETTSFKNEILSQTSIEKDRLGDLKMPVLALYGENSHALPSARALKRLCPQCFLRIIPGVGHFFPLTHSKNLVRTSIRFLQAQANGRI